MASRQVLLSKASRLGHTLSHLVWVGAPISRLQTSLVLAVFSKGLGRGANVKRTGSSEES